MGCRDGLGTFNCLQYSQYSHNGKLFWQAIQMKPVLCPVQCIHRYKLLFIREQVLPGLLVVLHWYLPELCSGQ